MAIKVTRALIATISFALTGCQQASRTADEPPREPTAALAKQADITFLGACDGSAAARLPDGQIVVANDENSKLRIYKPTGGAAADGPDLATDLSLTGDEPEPDIEAAATADGRIYWITSHGRKKVNDKKPDKSRLRDPDRFRFFATTHDGNLATVGVVGDELLTRPRLLALGIEGAEPFAPSEGGINIEGMAAGADGSMLLGFRSPLHDEGRMTGPAIVITLINAKALIDGAANTKGSPSVPQFGEPIRLDLGGKGIRDMVAVNGRFLLIAGDVKDGGTSFLYEWDGPGSNTSPRKKAELSFNAEALVDLGGGKILVLSDDGDDPRDGSRTCKDLKPAQQNFRGLVVSVAASGKA